MIGIGSARASLESNFALKRLVEQTILAQASERPSKMWWNCVVLLRHEAVHQASLAQIETADSVFILGEDIPKTASRVAFVSTPSG